MRLMRLSALTISRRPRINRFSGVASREGKQPSRGENRSTLKRNAFLSGRVALNSFSDRLVVVPESWR